MGQLETDLGPDLQNQFHAKVLPALVTVMMLVLMLAIVLALRLV